MNHERFVIFYHPETQEQEWYSWDSPDIPRRGDMINMREDGVNVAYQLSVWEVRHDAFIKNNRILTQTLIYAKVWE